MTEQDDRTFVDDARRYALDSRIATGGMGEVWRATDTVLDRTVAVKLLKAEYADDATFRSRFETEARHAASLHHPGVAAVYDFGEAAAAVGSEAPRPYLVMELVDGQPLSALLLPGQPLDPDAARDLLAQAADALGAAHAAGIVHRDVKPANLLVTPDRVVKITDFGIARATEGMALTETGQVMGTPQYISPEQAQGRQATPASDVYALGVVAFECLAGHRPFVADTAVATALAHLREPAPALPDEVPEDLADVVQRSLAKAPEDRFADGRAFAAALRDPASAAPVATRAAAGAAAVGPEVTQVLGTGAVPAAAANATPTGTPGTPAGSTPAGDRRRRTPWGWILLGLAIVAALVVVAVLANGTADPEPEGPATPTKSRQSRAPEPSPSTPAPTPTEEPSQTPATEEPSATPSEQPSETATKEPTPTKEPAPSEEPTSEEPTSEPPVTDESPAARQSDSPESGSDAAPAVATRGAA